MLSKEAVVIDAKCHPLLVGLNPIYNWLRYCSQGDTDRGNLEAKQVFPLCLPQLAMGRK